MARGNISQKMRVDAVVQAKSAQLCACRERDGGSHRHIATRDEDDGMMVKEL